MKIFSEKREIKTKLIILNTLLILTIEFCLPHQLLAAANQNNNINSLLLGPTMTQWENINGSDNHYAIPLNKPKAVKWVTVTAYSSSVDQCDSTPFITANGKHVYDGLVAANFLRFGTNVKLPDYFGDKVFTVNDRMNSKYSTRIDVWMPTREQAIQFGTRYLKVEIF